MLDPDLFKDDEDEEARRKHRRDWLEVIALAGVAVCTIVLTAALL